jgi:HlyD family secretion protein
MRIRLLCSAAAAAALAGCSRPEPAGWQGYCEGDYVYVASPIAGRLEHLAVQKGAQVAAGAPLFVLERASELAAQREAAAELQGAEARAADLAKGSRPTELAALRAKLDQARAAAALSQADLARDQALFASRAITASDYDHSRLRHEQDGAAVAQLAAELATAELGGRADALAAAAADIQAARAALAQSTWQVDQKAPTASCAALVYDTLYREGEFVAAGNPVVVLLPPENLKVRFFVSEADAAALRLGERVSVTVAGRPAAIAARVSYLSDQPEYTPPVLYNRDNRAKLVFMAEAAFDPADSAALHPGQPADVRPDR